MDRRVPRRGRVPGGQVDGEDAEGTAQRQHVPQHLARVAVCDGCRHGPIVLPNRSPRILRRMEGVLEETGNPGNLVSLRGLTKLFLPIS